MIRTLRGVLFLVAVLLGVTACGRSDAATVFTDPRLVELLAAASDGDRAGVDRLRAEGVDIDAAGDGGVTPLIWSVLVRDERAVRTLLGSGADPARSSGRDGYTALSWAARMDTPSMLTTLLDGGVDPSTRNTVTRSGALVDALMAERPENVTVLIDRGVDVDMVDRTGNTAMHQAAKINQPDAILELLAAGADPTLVNAQGSTFQPYLFRTPSAVRLDSANRDVARIEEELVRRGIPVER